MSLAAPVRRPVLADLIARPTGRARAFALDAALVVVGAVFVAALAGAIDHLLVMLQADLLALLGRARRTHALAVLGALLLGHDLGAEDRRVVRRGRALRLHCTGNQQRERAGDQDAIVHGDLLDDGEAIPSCPPRHQPRRGTTA